MDRVSEKTATGGGGAKAPSPNPGKGWRMNPTEQIVREMKDRPYTMIAVLSLLAFAGFAQNNHATATDIEKLDRKVDRVMALQLGESIRSVSRQICEATREANRRDLRDALERLQHDYREITGERYPVQPCETRSE